jgi:8-oxo-dGTP diphosphatase
MVLINGDADMADRLGADGVHFTSAQLAGLSDKPPLPWCAASCHTAQDLRKAEALGLDFVVLGPVLATPSHPDAAPLGWERFAALAEGARLPVYALGGMRPELLPTARRHGAHGLAMLRASWGG